MNGSHHSLGNLERRCQSITEELRVIVAFAPAEDSRKPR